MDKLPMPRVHRLSDEHREAMEKLLKEVHQRHEEMAAILEPYVKWDVAAVFEFPPPLSLPANSMTLPGFTFVFGRGGKNGVYDHGAGT